MAEPSNETLKMIDVLIDEVWDAVERVGASFELTRVEEAVAVVVACEAAATFFRTRIDAGHARWAYTAKQRLLDRISVNQKREES